MSSKNTAGRVVSKQQAQASIDLYKSRTLAENEVYVESFFFGADTLQELVSGTPLKSITGIRIHLAQVERDGGLAFSPVVEVISKDGTLAARGSDKVASDPPACPIFCN